MFLWSAMASEIPHKKHVISKRSPFIIKSPLSKVINAFNTKGRGIQTELREVIHKVAR